MITNIEKSESIQNMDTSQKFCSILFDVLEQNGVKDIICSPGSRNVPLLIAVASRQSMKKHFIVDERSAAFTGLGISLVSKRPVILICTSGTALLNYAPAVAEAYYQSIPLIVISADRPIQWIDQDDSQTLRQDSALNNYVKKSYSIPANGQDEEELRWYVNRISNDAFLTSISGRKGPVHINIHLSEPLGLKSRKENSLQRIITNFEADSLRNKEVFKELAYKLAQSKVMLVAGFSQPDSALQKAASEFSRLPNVCVMAETISNLHLKEEDYSIDSVLTSFHSDELDSFSPDIVISIGGALVSRKLKEYLRKNADTIEHWSIGYSHTTTDPFMSLTMKFELAPVNFFRSINSAIRKTVIKDIVAEYQNLWRDLRRDASMLKRNFIRECEWSELKAFDILMNNIPSSYNLFLSNGTAIRYAQIIKYKLPHASFCNRGVSGIDGSFSTAIGGAIAYKGKTVLITGDLSMAYDIGAFGIKEIPDGFKIIIIDNQGGGIFRFILTTSSLEEREEYLCQSPLLPLHKIAEGYGWHYIEAADEKNLREKLSWFFASKDKCILKVSCNGIKSAGILKSYMSLKIK